MKPDKTEESSFVSQRSASLSAGSTEVAAQKTITSIFDSFFPLFDEVNRVYPVNTFMAFIPNLVGLLQYMLTFSWCGHSNIWGGINDDPHYHKFVLFGVISDFGHSVSKEGRVTSATMFLIVLAFLFLIFIAITNAMYYSSRSFNNKALFVYRAIFSLFSPILVIPTANAAGYCFKSMMRNLSAVNVVVFALAFFSYVIHITLQFLVQQISSMTPFLPKNPYANWNGEYQLYLYFLGSGLAFFEYVFERFPLYFCITLTAVFDIAFMMTLKYAFQFIFFHDLTTCISATINFSMPFFTIFCFIKALPSLYRILVPYIIYLIIFIAVRIFIVFYKKKIRMTYDVSTEYKALQSIYVQISEDPEEFVSFNLLRSIAGIHSSTHILVRLSRVLALFPNEAQMLNQFITMLLHRTDMNLAERFAFFQIRRVYLLRQSSASHQMNEQLLEVQKVTSQIIKTVQEYWIRVADGKQPVSLESLIVLDNEIQKANLICLEATTKYPNSARFLREYAKLLIESRADYIGGTRVCLEAEQIDNGQHIVSDYAYRMFVNSFPVYLKKKILDFRGKKIVKNLRSGSTAGSSSSAGSTTNQMTENQFEEAAAKVLDYPKLRFALQRTLESLSNPFLSTIKRMVIVTIVILLAVILLLLVAFNDTFYKHEMILNVISKYNEVQKILSLLYFHASVHLSDIAGLSASAELVDELLMFNVSDEKTSDVTTFGEPKDMLLFWANQGISSLNGLCLITSNIAVHYSIFDKVMTNIYSEQPCIYCNSTGFKNPAVKIQGVDLITMLFRRFMETTELEPSTWHDSPLVCEIIANFKTTSMILDNMADLFILHGDSTVENDWKTFMIIMIALSVIIAIIFLGPFGYAMITFTKNFKGYVILVKNLPREGINKTIDPIMKQSSEEMKIATSSVVIDSVQKPFVLMPIIAILTVVITVANVVSSLMILKSSSLSYAQLNRWYMYATKRGSSILQSVALGTIGAVILKKGPFKLNSVASMELRADFNNLTSLALESHKELMFGVDSARYFSSDASAVTFERSCKSSVNGDMTGDKDTVGDIGVHGSYRCEGIDRLLLAFQRLQVDFLSDFAKGANMALGVNPLELAEYVQLKHAVTHHIFPLLIRFDDILNNGYRIVKQSFNATYYPVVVILFVIALGLQMYQYYIINKVFCAFEACKTTLSRFSPQFIISQPQLLGFVLGKPPDKPVNKKGTVEESVINSSPDSILAIDEDLTINSMNPSTKEIFGFNTEQLVGQNLSTILPSSLYVNSCDNENEIYGSLKGGGNNGGGVSINGNNNINVNNTTDNSTNGCDDSENNEKFYRQFALMKAGQIGMTYSCQVYGERDDGTPITLDATLFGINNGESFALILHDMTAVMKAQLHVEQAKKKAEKLLYQILPRDIVNRINQGETEISFSVASATIVFVDIVRFSEYSASLSARQIMQNLGLIFKRFDDILTRYETMTKIKLIGDIYMAAAGLFHPKIGGDVHASEVVSFAIEALKALDEVNNQLESNLQVRIGINSGGPLIAGVLGIDKPLFDIIGDPINVAARLQSTDLPNHIQISNGTYQLLKMKGFSIIERGEVQLKGKGLQMAYFVNPDETQNVIMEHLSNMVIPQFVPSSSGSGSGDGMI